MSSTRETPAAPERRRRAINAPKLIDPTNRKFRTLFDHYRSLQKEVFDDGSSKPSRHVFASHAEFSAALKSAEGFRSHFPKEIATMLASEEYELWPSQEVQMFELMQAPLLQHATRGKMSSVLNVSGAGTGKTRVAGKIPEAVRRMNERGVYNRGLLALVRRRAMILPQTLTTEDRAELLLGDNMTKEQLRMQETFVRQFFELCSVFDDNRELQTSLLRHRRTGASASIRSALLNDLRKTPYFDRMTSTPNFDQLLTDLSCMLSGEAVVVKSTDADDVELLRFSSETPEFAHGGGDLLADLPDEYRLSPRVHIHTSMGDIRKAGDHDLPDQTTDIAVFSRTSLLQDKSRQRISRFLSRVGVVLLDEAEGVSPWEFGSMVSTYGMQGDPDLFYASTASVNRDRAGYDSRLSYLAPKTAINRPESILKPQRLVRIETPDNALYPSGSYEAADQLIAHYGKVLALPKKLGVPQPTDGHHLVVVDSRLITYVTHMLRSLTAGQGTQVRSYASNKDEHVSALLQQVLNDPSAPPACIVAGPDAVLDSFDWRGLRSTWLGVHDSRNGEGIHRLCGRQFHTLADQSYIVYQQFSNPNTRNFLPHVEFSPDADMPPTGEFNLVQGQTFLGKENADSEIPTIRKLRGGRVTASARTKTREYEEIFVLKPGTFPPKLEDQRLASATSTVLYPVHQGDELPPDYPQIFARTNGISLDLFAAKLGESFMTAANKDGKLIALERAAHAARAASIRTPRDSYR